MTSASLCKFLLPPGTRGLILAVMLASSASAQLSFDFNFTDSNSGFNDPTQGAARRAALETAATNLSNQLPIATAVTVTFDVSSNNADDSTLASAGSGFIGDVPGFYPTIAHQKVLDGTDGNGSAADGEIEWNFFHDWDLDDDVSENSYDFISTAMHEILHAIGFTGAVFSDGSGLFEGAIDEPNAWHPFDRFLVDGSGNRLISDTFIFDSSQVSTLTGGSSVFFNGTNTLAANGGQPIVIYSPDPWEDGSSLSHTDDETYTGNNALLMNAATETGPGVRTLSAVELGILKDLGFELETNGGGAGGGSSDFAYLSNLSVRTLAGSGSQTLIAGFVIAGGDKAFLARGIGPTLTNFGVAGALEDPRLSLFSGTTEFASNDDWEANDADTFQSVGAFALPDDSADAAIVTSLAPGAYTMQITGADGQTGVSLAEIYDTAAASDGEGPRFTNISARSAVGTGSEVLVAGFVVAGSGEKSLLIRGLGPTLGNIGVAGALSDPQLSLFRSEGTESTLVRTNDDWNFFEVFETSERLGAFELSNSKDSAMLVTLQPGVYTVQMSGVSEGTGVGLIEVYDAD